MFDMLQEKLFSLNDRLDKTIVRAKKAVNTLSELQDDGDRKWFCFVDSFDFSEKSNKIENLNFNVSGDADFVAKRLLFALRIHREGGGVTDPAGQFRSYMFAHDQIENILDATKVDGQFELIETYEEDGKEKTRKFQNQYPIPVSNSYSHNNHVFGSPSGMHFDVDWLLPRNSVLQCRFKVLTSLNNITPAQDFDTYRVIGVLEGYKKLRAFK